MPDALVNDIRLEIELLKKDVTVITTIVNKLDSTTEKLQDLSASVIKMLALHEEKLLQSAREDKDILGEIRIHTDEDQNRFNALEGKISDLADSINEKMSRTETNILAELRSANESKNENETGMSWARKMFGIYPWMLAGGVTTVFWMMSHVNLVELSKLIK